MIKLSKGVYRFLSLSASVILALSANIVPLRALPENTAQTEEIKAIPVKSYDIKRAGGFGNRVYPENCNGFYGESFDRNIEWEISQTRFTSVSSCNLRFLNINQTVQNTVGFLFHISVPEKTTVSFVAALNFPQDTSRWRFDYVPSLSPLTGKGYSFISDGGTEWSKAALVSTSESGSEYMAGLYFEKAFSGYVKLPYSSVGNDSGFVFKPEYDSVNSLIFYFDRFGGKYGEVTVGPNFFIEEDGCGSKITVEKEYYGNAAYRTVIYERNRGAAIGSAESGAVINKRLGIKGVTLGAAQLYECPANITVGEQNDTYINGICSEPLKSTDGILFYIKLPGTNLVLPDLVLKDPHNPNRWAMPYSPVLSLYEGEKCYALPLGDNKWQEMTVKKAYTTGYSGGLEFDGAFEGFVKIPYTAFKNDSGFSLLTDADILEQFKLRFERIGGSYGDISVSDCYLLTGSSPSAEISLTDYGAVTAADSALSADKAFARHGERVKVTVSTENGCALKADGLYITYTDFSGARRKTVSEYSPENHAYYFEMPKTDAVALHGEFIQGNEQSFAVISPAADNSGAVRLTFRELVNSGTAPEKGVLITLESSLGGKMLTADIKNTDIIDIRLSSADTAFETAENNKYADYYVTLENIKPENRGKNYIVRGYSISGGEYTYTEQLTVNYNELCGALSDYESFSDAAAAGSFYDIDCSYVSSPFPQLAAVGGIKAEAKTPCDVPLEDVQDSPYWFRIENEPVKISNYYCIGIYVKVSATRENGVYMTFGTADGSEYKIPVGKKYRLLSKASGTAEERTTVEGKNGSYHGIITLPAGFEGLVCVPLSALSPRNSITDDTEFTSITCRFSYMGSGENAVTAGPVVGFKQKIGNSANKEITEAPIVSADNYKTDIAAAEMTDDKALLYWDECAGAENYLLKAYKKAVGGYVCIAEKVYFSNSGALDCLKSGEEYYITVSARDSRDSIIAEYKTERLIFTPASDYREVSAEPIIYDIVDYTDGNIKDSPFVKRSYTALNAYHSAELNLNPNRGFRGCMDFFNFKLTDSEIAAKIDAYALQLKNAGINSSVYVCYFYPGDYISGDLNAEFFTAAQKIFDCLRERKMQILLRFAYYDENNFNSRTPTTAEILRHISNLSENGIIERNKDVLHAFQVGFIGKYGEWHSDTPASTSADRGTALNAFAEKLLPSGIYAQLRMPNYSDYLSGENILKYGGKFGYHLDSFFGIADGSETGSGIYSYRKADWNRHISEAYCAPNDAEAYYYSQFDDLGAYPDGYGSIIAASQLRLTTFSAINGYIDQGTSAPGCINKWKKLPVTEKWLEYNNLPYTKGWFTDNGGNKIKRNAFEYIRDYLGYRLVCKELSVTEKSGGMNISLSLQNYGFAAAFNITARLTLLDTSGNEIYSYAAGNPAEWYGAKPGTVPDGELITYYLKADMPLPSSGKYKLALRLISKSGAAARLDNSIPYENGYNILHEFTVN